MTKAQSRSTRSADSSLGAQLGGQGRLAVGVRQQGGVVQGSLGPTLIASQKARSRLIPNGVQLTHRLGQGRGVPVNADEKLLSKGKSTVRVLLVSEPLIQQARQVPCEHVGLVRRVDPHELRVQVAEGLNLACNLRGQNGLVQSFLHVRPHFAVCLRRERRYR